MRNAIRRFGPVLFWQYAWLLVVVLPIGALASWIASGGSVLELLCAVGMTVVAMAGLLLSKSVARLTGGEGRGPLRALAIPDDLRRIFLQCQAFSPMAVMTTLDDAMLYGIGWAVVLILITWHMSTAVGWVAWGLGFLRPESDALAPRTDPGPGRTRSRFAGAEGGTMSVEVEPREALTLSEAVKDVLETQYLPAIRGGRREWTVLVDGTAVGIVTQSWEHPKFWRPIVWSADPRMTFDGRVVSFEPVPEPVSRPPVGEGVKAVLRDS